MPKHTHTHTYTCINLSNGVIPENLLSHLRIAPHPEEYTPEGSITDTLHTALQWRKQQRDATQRYTVIVNPPPNTSQMLVACLQAVGFTVLIPIQKGDNRWSLVAATAVGVSHD